MEKVRLNWQINSNEEDSIIRRYCHNCGKLAIFKDSGIRRHNANGKNIHAYAIYKCDKDHTWNDKLAKYKAQSEDYTTIKDTDTQPKSIETAVGSPPSPEKISLADLQQQGTMEVEILLETVQGKWRLDKLLAQQLSGISRSEIVKGINGSRILLNGKQVKPSELVQENQVIRICMTILEFHSNP
ncbi:S4 domain-containing protein [Paenibacillus psychroresistens]|uniref:S4 domain-containing protein n=1 Tax=Paenibacillus psychroresistens TaxID=1778678 RepID=UPI001390BAAD|nr:S4 domain-containing protein [Paenibacillus psychroresistens]